MKKILLISILVSAILETTFCQTESVVSIDSIVDQFLLHQKAVIPNTLLSDEANGFLLLTSLERYRASPEATKRKNVYKTVLKIATLNDNSKVKEKALNVLLLSAFDSVSHVRSHFSEAFQDFDRQYFSDNFDKNIRKLLHDEQLATKEIILLSGFLGLTDEKQFIKSAFVEKGANGMDSLPNRNSRTYAAQLALARMEGGNFIKELISLLKKATPDEITRYLEDIAYTKQPAALAFLLDQLYRDEKLSANCGFQESFSNRVVHLLAKEMVGFPLATKKSGLYSAEETATVRDWASREKGSIIFNLNKW